MVAAGAPGVAAVIRGPGGVERYAVGLADVRRGTPISSRDAARTGSVNKTFTATVVLQLVGEGKLRLDDSVQRWLPGLVPNGDHITVRQLLNQTSGLPDYCGVPPSNTLCDPRGSDMGRFWTQRELVDISVGAPPLFPPGEGWSYSNTGYVLLGMIIRQVTGHTLAFEYQHRIFTPLGLHHTRFSLTTSMPNPYSHGYEVLAPGNWPLDVTSTSPTIAWAAGGIVSTDGDLTRFMRALLGGRLLKSTLLRQMKVPTPGSLAGLANLGILGTYGYGLVHYTWAGDCGVFGHRGDFPGYHTLAVASNGRRGGAMYDTTQGAPPSLILATAKAERLISCRMRFGRIGK
jgi:D-alanyl-D-alanine carboxypeptidase